MTAFPRDQEQDKGYQLSALLFNIVLEVPARKLGKKIIKGILIEKEEVKVFLFAADMILHIENTRNCTENQ